ncbi:hypothetical protein ACWDD9_31575 [Kitasatospora sp. NPDC001119]
MNTDQVIASAAAVFGGASADATFWHAAIAKGQARDAREDAQAAEAAAEVTRRQARAAEEHVAAVQDQVRAAEERVALLRRQLDAEDAERRKAERLTDADRTMHIGTPAQNDLSPRARGRPDVRCLLVVLAGAIPASAGPTLGVLLVAHLGGSYPRERGADTS